MDGGPRRVCSTHAHKQHTHTHTQAAFRLVLRDMSQLCREAFLFHCTQMNATVYFLTEYTKVWFSCRGPVMFHQTNIDVGPRPAQLGEGWGGGHWTTNSLMTHIYQHIKLPVGKRTTHMYTHWCRNKHTWWECDLWEFSTCIIQIVTWSVQWDLSVQMSCGKNVTNSTTWSMRK